ncbi:YacL family protein [Saccharophagus degradans]|uniref:YacL family protein n=1 Tax=Saccharophagus degradans TaxID=86304 RepID=A0AAW7X561_9GAMM|nr:YacL family protein [Saccharophagus degradans]MDO6421816.1 YacL family protein [Saccharophagus degradans]MDO6606490.1 YacL family protein [Saccharophagus degradans]
MEYEFNKDLGGSPVATFSMGHEAIGRWLTDELASNTQRITSLLSHIEQIELGHKASLTLHGSEFELHIAGDEVSVKAHAIDDDIEFKKNISLYELESNAECGLTDFKEALQSWLQFVTKSR